MKALSIFASAAVFAAFVGPIATTWTNICVSGQAEGRNVRCDVLSDGTSVHVSVICDEGPHTEPIPDPDPGMVPSTP